MVEGHRNVATVIERSAVRDSVTRNYIMAVVSATVRNVPE